MHDICGAVVDVQEWWLKGGNFVGGLDLICKGRTLARAGMAASKKWKYTLRVDKPEAKSCTLGAYLDQLGVLEKSGR